MHQLSTGIVVLFVTSCILALLIPLLRGGLLAQLQWQPGATGMQRLKFGLPVMLALYGLAAAAHLDVTAGLPYFLVAYVGYWALSCLALAPLLRGIILLLIAFIGGPLPAGGDSTQYLPMLSYFFGLLAGRLSDSKPGWEDFTLPATWLIGQYWIAVSMTDATMPSQMGLLMIFIAIGLLLRTASELPIFPQEFQKKTFLRPLFLVLTGGLVAWLAIQNLLLQPTLLNWVWLFAGGLALSFLLAPTISDASPSAEENLFGKVIQVVLIGLATLVASRLFGTLGWLVLAAAMLGNDRVRTPVAIAALFWLSRSLLQGFIFQYNPNVTGINITHPYASAALYVGFIIMLLFPVIANHMAVSKEPQTESITFRGEPLAWALVLAACILSGGLTDYFLHAEAAGSLLTALTVAGLGVSLLGTFSMDSLRVLPLLFALLISSSVLLAQELLTTGNEAEKTQKILVLGLAFALFALIFWLAQRSASGRKPVAVA